MTSREAECTCKETEKHKVWPNGDRCGGRCDAGAQFALQGPGCRHGRFAIRRQPGIIQKIENYRSFLDIYDLVWAAAADRLVAKRPGPDMSHER
jgi:hypothetical protein